MTTQGPRWRALALGLLVVVLAAALAVVLWVRNEPVMSGRTLDEALAAGRDAASFPAADEDYFHDMDGGSALTPEEVKAQCWMKYENDKKIKNIDARLQLVEKCVDDTLRGQLVQRPQR